MDRIGRIPGIDGIPVDLLLIDWTGCCLAARAGRSQLPDESPRRFAATPFEKGGEKSSPSFFQREQLCQQGIALCQVLFDFTIALSTVSSFRMQAVMATLGCLPAARSRSWNARISGLQRIALIVAM